MWLTTVMQRYIGDRRDFFVAQHDPWQVIRVITEGRKRRKIAPTIVVLRECVEQLKAESETPVSVRERLAKPSSR